MRLLTALSTPPAHGFYELSMHGDEGPATNRQPGLSPLAQQTETVQPGVPCSLRAKANAFSAGISRIFLTGLPRRPRNSTSQGVVPSFWTPG